MTIYKKKEYLFDNQLCKIYRQFLSWNHNLKSYHASFDLCLSSSLSEILSELYQKLKVGKISGCEHRPTKKQRCPHVDNIMQMFSQTHFWSTFCSRYFCVKECSNVTHLSINWSTKSSNSADAEHISLSTWKSKKMHWPINTLHLIMKIWQRIKKKQQITSVKSVLSRRADEQSTKGTRVTNVAINWNVIYRHRDV